MNNNASFLSTQELAANREEQTKNAEPIKTVPVISKSATLNRLKQECASMTRKLKKLKDEEKMLAGQTEVMAREIIDMGYPHYAKN